MIGKFLHFLVLPLLSILVVAPDFILIMLTKDQFTVLVTRTFVQIMRQHFQQSFVSSLWQQSLHFRLTTDHVKVGLPL